MPNKRPASTTAERQRKLRNQNQAAALRDGFKDGLDPQGNPLTRAGKPVTARSTALRLWALGMYILVRNPEYQKGENDNERT